MDFEQKAEALGALAPLAIIYREPHWRIGSPDPWYVRHDGVEVKDRSVLRSAFGNGCSPVMAINDHWYNLVENIQPHEYIIVKAADTNRRAVRWNGFMWADVPEPKPE